MDERISEDAARLRAQWNLTETRHLARHTILTALESTKGNAVHAARNLGIAHRTLMRYMADPTLAEGLEKVRARAAKGGS